VTRGTAEKQTVKSGRKIFQDRQFLFDPRPACRKKGVPGSSKARTSLIARKPIPAWRPQMTRHSQSEAFLGGYGEDVAINPPMRQIAGKPIVVGAHRIKAQVLEQITSRLHFPSPRRVHRPIASSIYGLNCQGYRQLVGNRIIAGVDG